MNKSQLEAIRARCEAATPGPWYTEKTGANFNGFELESTIAVVTGRMPIYAEAKYGSFPSSDRAFIAHAREDIPELLIEVERWQKECGRLIDLCGSLHEELTALCAAKRWIPISEKIPYDGIVEVYIPSTWPVSTANFTTICGKPQFTGIGGGVFVGVTHWRPLPEAPKGEEK